MATISSSLRLFLVLASLACHASRSSGATTPYLQNGTDADSQFQALHCLKLHLARSPGVIPASWKNDSLPFCSWSGVTCSSKIRHPSRRRVVVALDLDSLGLDGQIPPCISNLTFVARINLANNQLSSQIPPEIGNLNTLRYLNLSRNNLSGMIPATLSSSLRIQIISLATNSLSGNIPLSLGSSSSLCSLFLQNNSLTGSIPPLLAKSLSLQVLDLTNNHLSGEIPPVLFNSTSLQELWLGENSFTGSIPASYSSIGLPLECLGLRSNKLSGTIPSSLGNFSSLRLLLLGANNFQGGIPTSLGKILNLQQLSLSYNNLSGTVPACIYNMSSLTLLNMAINNLVGAIPYDIGYTLSNIRILIMQGNQFQGQIPTSLANATNLQNINLRNNAFHGIVPSFGTLSNLIDLNLGDNALEAGDWSFLSSLTNCTRLVKLRLDANNLQGVLPTSFASLSNTIEILLLRSNSISGTIPQKIEHLTNLTLFYMGQNLLTGNLPCSLGNLPKLVALSLPQNKISGHIPISLGNLSQLSELYLQENNLSGQIPAVFGDCKKLTILNLSYNSFDGSIPKELFTLSSLSEGLDLSHNQLSGQIPVEIGNLINLGTLSISNNQLSGQIPSTLGQCVRLELLHMEANFLQGGIPDALRNLRGVIVMDLSQNNLSGEVPDFFESFTSMTLLNLSFNNLDGAVPTGGIFQNRSEVFIQGNNNLCASTPLLDLPLCNAEASKQSHTSKILKIVGFTSLSLVLLSCFVIILVKKRKKFQEQPPHPSCKELNKVTYANLVKATNGFSLDNLVGSGKYGSVYRGRFELEDHPLAIKVFKLDQLGALKSFVTECEALRNTRHRNLVRVITVCSTFDPTGHEFKALVLEYMVNGDLESWLHPTFQEHRPRRRLSLGTRIAIAVDIAAALDYLHNHCIPPMVHCDMKPSNILLDDFMDVRVSDFGLAKFLHTYTFSGVHSSTSLVGPRGSIGYIAPEYGFGSKISTEGDVYSYGIIILEILTGKRPTDEMFKDGLSLHRFVEKAFPHKVGEILDPSIAPDYGGEGKEADVNLEKENNTMAAMSCIMNLIKLGLLCSVETPKDRPTMQDVYSDITTIRMTFLALRD